jgi:hypothetical protein
MCEKHSHVYSTHSTVATTQYASTNTSGHPSKTTAKLTTLTRKYSTDGPYCQTSAPVAALLTRSPTADATYQPRYTQSTWTRTTPRHIALGDFPETAHVSVMYTAQ